MKTLGYCISNVHLVIYFFIVNMEIGYGKKGFLLFDIFMVCHTFERGVVRFNDDMNCLNEGCWLKYLNFLLR